MPVVINNPPPRDSDGSNMAGWVIGLLIVVVLVIALIYLLPRILSGRSTNNKIDVTLPSIQVQSP